MRESCCRSGIGQVVGRDIDRLERGNRTFFGGSDAFLEVAHFGRERRLVSDGAWHAAQQRGDFGTGLREAEDVIDEEQNVLVFFVAEIFRDRKRGKSDAETRSRWLVHLTINKADS